MILLKIDKRIMRVIKILTYLLLLLSVITKLFCVPYISHKFHLLGISDFCHLFALIELIGVAFFLYEKTIGLGLVFLCSYFGGAIATDIHSPEYLYQPLVVLSFVFISAFVRRPGIFHELLTLHDATDSSIIFFKAGRR